MRLKLVLLSLTFLLSSLLFVASAPQAHADISKNLCAGSELSISGNGSYERDKDGDIIKDKDGHAVSKCGANNKAESSLDKIIKAFVNIFSVVVGIVAVIMIIIGGFKYITSGGDSGKVGSAKNTIIYAIIGLIIVALAQVLVRFVISKASGVEAS